MSFHDRNFPPTAWCTWWEGVTRLTDDIYYGWFNTVDTEHPWFWHWCPPVGRWVAKGTTARFQMASRDPLTLHPSLMWTCCGKHGYMKDGVWLDVAIGQRPKIWGS